MMIMFLNSMCSIPRGEGTCMYIQSMFVLSGPLLLQVLR